MTSNKNVDRNLKVRAIVFSALLIVSMVAPFVVLDDRAPIGGAEAVTLNETYDDFEDGDAATWTGVDSSASDPTNYSVVSGGFNGKYSLKSTDPNQVEWTEGPQFHTQQTFEVSGTLKHTDGGSGSSSNFGIVEEWHQDSAGISINGGGDSWGLYKYENGTLTSTSRISLGYDAATNWSHFRLRFEDGVMKAKLWEAGTGEPDKWQLEMETHPDLKGPINLAAGGNNLGREIYLGQIDAGGNTVSGKLVDQNGEPIPNATMEAVGVDKTSLNDSISDKEQRAQELLDEAENPLPTSWNESMSLSGDGGHFEEATGQYVAVHTQEDWQLNGRNLPGLDGVEVNVDPELKNARLVAPEDEPLVLSTWDATETCGTVTNRCDAADQDLPGRTSNTNIVMERLSPSGEVVDRKTYKTKDFVTLNPSFSFSTKTHQAVVVNPEPGFYRVYPAGEPQERYTVAVGNPDTLRSMIERDLKSEADKLTDQAQTIRNYVQEGKFKRTTATTDENGNFTIRMPKGVETVSIQSYRADGTVLRNVTQPTLGDLRTRVNNGGYNGSFYIAPPQRVDAPSSNVTIRAYRTNELPYRDMQNREAFFDFLENQRLDEKIAELEAGYQESLDAMQTEQLESIYGQLKPLVETNPAIKKEYLKRSSFDSVPSASDLSADELRTEISHMQQSLYVANRIQGPEGENKVNFEDGSNGTNLLNAEYPAPDGVTKDDVVVELTWSNGSVEILSEKYWSIKSDGVFGGKSVVVEDYPIREKDPAAANLRVRMVGQNDNGETGVVQRSERLVNPSFSGQVPEINSIDISTLSPGDSEEVSFVLRPKSGTGFREVQTASVISPQGNTLPATVSKNGTVTFTTDGQGVHFVEVVYINEGGTKFTETFKVRALDQPRSNPPTVRVTGTDSPMGPTVMAGQGLNSATVEIEDSKVAIDAIVPSGSTTPGVIHVKPGDASTAAEQKLTVDVLRGEEQETVRSHVSVVVHLDQLSDESTVWRGSPAWTGGQPLTSDGNRYGQVETRENGKTIIRSYTDSTGSLKLTINEDPSRVESLQHTLAVSASGLPVLTIGIVPLGGGSAASLGIVALVWRRRRCREVETEAKA